MAERSVFVPRRGGTKLVDEVPFEFDWSSGFAPSQKRKNVRSLHAASVRAGLAPLLEVSSKSECELGLELSAFALPFSVDGIATNVESVYQGSKAFERGGPYTDLYLVPPRAARKDKRLRTSGRLIAFQFEHKDYPLTPTTAFYDWIYMNALYRLPRLRTDLQRFAGFTDIEFNPKRSLNCQARSCATFVSLIWRGEVDDAVESFEHFTELLTAQV